MKSSITVRILSLILALTLIIGCMGLGALAADDSVTIKLHYHRPDGKYDGWDVWFWNFGFDGTGVPFALEGEDQVATFQAAPGTTSVGFIVRLGNWSAKDVPEDQFIDIGPYLSGTVHVYVESGVKGYEIKLGDDIVSGIKLSSVVYKDGLGIQVQMTGTVDPAAFTVMGPDGKVAIASATEGSQYLYTLVPEAPLDLTKSYTLIYESEEYEIKMPNIYSTADFEAKYTYTGSDLGATWTKEQTTFRVWAPTAASVKVNLYTGGDASVSDLVEQLEMTVDANGTWVAAKEGDLNGTYYTYMVEVNGVTNEACDPYARTTGVNGKRAMVIDLDSTDPAGWDQDKDPHYDNSITDAVIYELHVRDLSVDANSGITNKGKFLGLIETGTTSPDGKPTGLDHIKNLGVTHVHLLPSYDYGSVDESRLDVPQFNWGYDPVNYNVPEGSYSTDPYKGEVRVQEFKQMVKGMHDNGISVIMDVVYNHVYSGGDFCFNQIVPQYFSRVTDNGTYSNGSGCGNDTASERAMVKKYIVDSVVYWADEYHIDGFRFDLVGLLDTETINAIMEEVHKTHPNVIFYGEGWTMSTMLTKDGYTMATQQNHDQVPGFAFFSDSIRDAIRGSVFNNYEQGYISGGAGSSGEIARGFMATPSWCKDPTQIVNYASCHDNMTLFDRIVNSTPKATRADQIRMNNLAAAIVMTSQGVPFIQAGEEILRSKPDGKGGFDENSYASSDAVNNIKWADLSNEEYQKVLAYYQGLIAFRQAHPALRMTTTEDVAAHIEKLSMPTNSNGFHITPGANGENEEFAVFFNPNEEAISAQLPTGTWTIYVNADKAGLESLGTVSGTVELEPISAMVLIKTGAENLEPPTEVPTEAPTDVPTEPGNDGSDSLNKGLIAGAAAAAAAAVAAGVAIVLKKRKK